MCTRFVAPKTRTIDPPPESVAAQVAVDGSKIDRSEMHLFDDSGRAGDFFRRMDQGGHCSAIRQTLRRFNGGLFRHAAALPITEDELEALIAAARRDWASVEPAIFGALLEQASGSGTRRVRAFGDMVAVLCGQGNAEAAVRLPPLRPRTLGHPRPSLCFSAVLRGERGGVEG